jgi:hypothetical protein
MPKPGPAPDDAPSRVPPPKPLNPLPEDAPTWLKEEHLEPDPDEAHRVALLKHHMDDPMVDSDPMAQPIYDLHPKHKAFADEWLTGAASGRPFHLPSAYAHAGYTVDKNQPSANPSKLLRHPKVQKYIKKRMEEFSMTPMEVLARFTQIARGQFGDVLKIGPTGAISVDKDAVMQNRHLIKSFGFDNNGEMKMDFHDPVDALKQITRILGMNKDGLEVTGAGGGPVVTQVQFINPDGSQAHLGPTSELSSDVEIEDFSEFDVEADYEIVGQEDVMDHG